ncbi:hypothetical protein, partial [Flavobacterium psychrophilum]|uniref:hypothetical protein n=1 Tax=Flavobacterium psychrophilum TaxID=96345 RepID=UPI0039EBA8E6
GDEKPSLLSHDVLPSPALLDFLREQALSKTPQSGGSLVASVKNFKIETFSNNKNPKTMLILHFNVK